MKKPWLSAATLVAFCVLGLFIVLDSHRIKLRMSELDSSLRDYEFRAEERHEEYLKQLSRQTEVSGDLELNILALDSRVSALADQLAKLRDRVSALPEERGEPAAPVVAPIAAAEHDPEPRPGTNHDAEVAINTADYPILGYDEIPDEYKEQYKPWKNRAVFIQSPIHDGFGVTNLVVGANPVLPTAEQRPLLEQLSAAYFEEHARIHDLSLELIDSGNSLVFDSYNEMDNLRRKYPVRYSMSHQKDGKWHLFDVSEFNTDPHLVEWRNAADVLGSLLIELARREGHKANGFGTTWHENPRR